MEFRILGPLEVRAGSRDVALGGEKRRALLAMLLLHAERAGERGAAGPGPLGRRCRHRGGQDGARARVADPRGARRSRRAGDHARRLPAARRAGRARRGALRGAAAAGTAALADGAPERAAELLRDALALWRGSVLADLRYEAFAQAAIARLEELRWDAIEARNDADLELGRADAVLAELERRADEAPLRERLVEQRMRALYAAGRHVEALAVYREAQRRLDAELGLQPGPALRELERAVLGHDASLRPRAPAGPAAAADDDGRAGARPRRRSRA